MFSWQNETFPIPDESTELSHGHFEDIRTRILLLRNLAAGTYTYDTASPITAATWESYVDGLVADPDYYGPPWIISDGPPKIYGYPNVIPAGWSAGLVGICYKANAGVDAEFYSMIDTDGLTLGQLKANPPTDADGNLNQYWKHAPNYNSIRSWNKTTERWIVGYESGADPYDEDSWESYAIPMHEYAMFAADPAKQRKPIRYEKGEESERIMPHRLLSVEVLRRQITDSPTLGPNYNLESWYDADAAAWKVGQNIYGKKYDARLSQYWSGDHPDIEKIWEEGGSANLTTQLDGEVYTQYTKDVKLNQAMQNQIEHLLSRGPWVWPVDLTGTLDDNGVGVDYFTNWVKYHFSSYLDDYAGWDVWDDSTEYDADDEVIDPGSALPYIAIQTATNKQPKDNPDYWRLAMEWQDDVSYTTTAPDRVLHKYLDRWSIYQCHTNNTDNEPTPAAMLDSAYNRPWDHVSSLAEYARMDDLLWGCNMSPFELGLKIHGAFDWWLDTDYPFMEPNYVKARGQYAGSGSPPPSQSQVDEMYPVPVATWRRTWRRTMGGAKTALADNKMWPQSKGEPESDAYNGTSGWAWIGSYLSSMPTIELTEGEQAGLNARHGGSFQAGYMDELEPVAQPAFESVKLILNDAWEILDLCQYTGAEATVEMQWRRASYNPEFEEIPEQYRYDTAAEAVTGMIEYAERALAGESIDAFYVTNWGSLGLVGAYLYFGTSGNVMNDAYSGNKYYYSADTTLAKERIKVSRDSLIQYGAYIADTMAVLVVFNQAMAQYGSATGGVEPVEVMLPDGETTLEVPIKSYGDYTMRGPVLPVVLEMDDDEDYIYGEFTRVNAYPAPTTTGTVVSGCGMHELITPQVFFKLNLDSFGIGVFENVIPTYTELSVDSGKFDSAGLLID